MNLFKATFAFSVVLLILSAGYSSEVNENMINAAGKGDIGTVKDLLTKGAAEENGLKLKIYLPDLTNIRAWVEVCDLIHAFISKEDGFTGGTRFEVEHALKRELPVQFHWENGISQ